MDCHGLWPRSDEWRSRESWPIDAAVLQWLKSAGKVYQTRMNAILRDAMLRQP
jgi:uncharacterized protein (DUF4415 family)